MAFFMRQNREAPLNDRKASAAMGLRRPFHASLNPDCLLSGIEGTRMSVLFPNNAVIVSRLEKRAGFGLQDAQEFIFIQHQRTSILVVLVIKNAVAAGFTSVIHQLKYTNSSSGFSAGSIRTA